MMYKNLKMHTNWESYESNSHEKMDEKMGAKFHLISVEKVFLVCLWEDLTIIIDRQIYFHVISTWFICSEGF
jgi:hypothetical protein